MYEGFEEQVTVLERNFTLIVDTLYICVQRVFLKSIGY